MTLPSSLIISSERFQNTLSREISFSGIGIHTGECVYMTFVPAPENTGILFQRIDLPNQPIIPANLKHVVDTSRCTILGINSVRIHTVEHVLAALKAFKIDNLIIQVSNLEPPVANGGSFEFVQMIEEAGIKCQNEKIPIFTLNEPIYWSNGDIHLIAIPDKEYRISYTLHYPQTQMLSSQYCSFSINSKVFKNEIAPCRTFSLYSEVSALMDHGLIKGGSLDNAVIIKDDAILSKGGLFFKDEMARHKILDLIGDLSLIGFDILAHIISIKSGHASNYALAKKIDQEIHEGSTV